MEIKILNSIVFKELMPWLFKNSDLKSINEKLKKVNINEPVNDLELFNQINQLISDFPELSKWLNKQAPTTASPLVNHIYKSETIEYTDAISKFYALLIDKETKRLFNLFVSKSAKWNNNIKVIYNTNTALSNIKALAKNVIKEIKDRGFEEMPKTNSTLSHFVLYYLLIKLVQLFFDIQEVNKASLTSPISVEDFYLTELLLPKSKIISLEKTVPDKQIETIVDKTKLKFGFSTNKEALRKIISELCSNIELLDESKTSQEQLLQVLTAKDLKVMLPKIHIKCETVQFSYIVDKLKKSGFKNFNPTTIQESALFYTITGKQFTKQNLYSNNKDTPKQQVTIDKILNQLK